MARPARIIPAAALVLAAILVAGVAAWPRLSTRGFYADGAGTIHEPASRARPRRVLWQPPAAVGAVSSAADEYEPRLSADGQTLWFVRGRAGHNAEIYASARVRGGWGQPAPAPFNTGADELGPEPLPDGSGLLFYSDREGGAGGYDLWLVRREEEGEGWGEPVNLGGSVNTVFNEYNPALAPDGRALYFASNRPRPGEAAGTGTPPWPATVRERFGGHDYDLYAAPFEDGVPGAALGLTALNTPANEGTPAVSPAGDFLYFSSDRKGGIGGFDLYRSRLSAGVLGAPENLGEAVNSRWHELDPALSLAGFGLDFSSDRPQGESGAGDYNLFHTESREVRLEREARTFDLAGLWSAVAPWLLAILLLLLLLLLLRVSRDVLRHRRLSTLTKCLIGSLLAHILILLLLSLWGVTNSIGELFRRPGGSRVHLTSAPASDDLAAQVRGGLTSPEAPAPQLISAAAPAVPLPPVEARGPEVAPAPVESTPAVERVLVESRPAPAAPAGITDPDVPVRVSDLPAPRAEAASATTERGMSSAAPESPLAQERPELPAPAVAAAAAPGPSRVAAAPAAGAPVPNASTPGVAAPALAMAEPGAREAASPAGPSAPVPAAAAREQVTAAPAPAAELATGAAPVPVARPEAAPRRAPGASLAASRADVPVTLAERTPAGAAPPFETDDPAPREATELAAPRERAVARSEPAEPVAPAPDVSAPSSAGAVVLPPTHRAGARPATRPAELAPSVAVSALAREAAPARAAAPAEATLEVPHAPERLAADLRLPTERPASPNPSAPPETRTAGPGAPAALDSPAPVAIPVSPAPGRVEAPAPERADAPALSLEVRDRAPAPTAADAAPELSDVPPPALTSADLRVPTEVAPAQTPYPQRAPEVREKVLEARGGDKETEAAVERALSWLARHQSRGGKWDSKGFDDRCGECSGAATVDADIATTSLALLCFFGHDDTHLRDGPYRENVGRGLEWLLKRQSESGDLRGDESMYTHAIATIALAEAYGMTRDPRLEEPVRKAVAFIAEARSPKGGWRYEPGQFGDTSVLGWQLMAMVSAKRAGIAVPEAELAAARDWLERVSQRPGVYSYQPGQAPTASMTAEGWFCRQLLGEPRESERVAGSREFLSTVKPKWGRRSTTYLWYYATLAYFQHGGEEWDRWNGAVKRQLVEHQEKEGAAAGSWEPVDRWATSGGRVYQTAICTLTLEVYYRYLPMYSAGNEP